jgi:hypothetical protein
MHRRKLTIQETKLVGEQGFVSESQFAGTLFNAVGAILKKEPSSRRMATD